MMLKLVTRFNARIAAINAVLNGKVSRKGTLLAALLFWRLFVGAQTLETLSPITTAKPPQTYEDILAVYGDVFELGSDTTSSTVQFRTNRHLRFFDAHQPLYCQIEIFPEDDATHALRERAEFLRKPAPAPWAPLNFVAQRYGLYFVRFAQPRKSGKACHVYYAFYYDKNPNTPFTVYEGVEDCQ